MNASFAIMSSPPTARKKAEALRITSFSSFNRLLSRRNCASSAASALCPSHRRCRSRCRHLKVPCLQLTGCDPKLGRNTRVGHARLRWPRHCLLFVLRRELPSHSFRHVSLPVQRLLWAPVRDRGERSLRELPCGQHIREFRLDQIRPHGLVRDPMDRI